MNKKVVVILLVVLVAVAGFFAYNTFFGPETQVGEKEVTLKIVVESEGIDKTYTINTDQELLYDLMLEVEDKIQAEFDMQDFGPMLVGLEGYQADMTKEYFHIKINGEDAMVGVKDTPVIDGDTYEFIVTTF